jgi:hypothetical protein
MSYTFNHTPLCEDITRYIHTFSKKNDRLQKSPTSTLMKKIFEVRNFIHNRSITSEQMIIYSMYVSAPSAWLFNIYSENDWDIYVQNIVNNRLYY